MTFLESVLHFAGPTLSGLVSKAVQIGMELPAIAAIVIPNTIEHAVQLLEAEIEKRLSDPAKLPASGGK